jgi:tetratricopeptide (TPR) repeat protein
MSKKLSEIDEMPSPPPELERKAKGTGAHILTHEPGLLMQFVMGKVTLGELEGIDKQAQHRLARVGFDLLSEGKLDQATTIFEGLLTLDPYDAYFAMALGAIAQRQNALEKADHHYSRAISLNPALAPALANRGEVRLSMGRFEEAVADLSASLKEDPKAKDPSTQRARAILATIGRRLEIAQQNPAAAKAEAEATLKNLGEQTPKTSLVRKPPQGKRVAKRTQTPAGEGSRDPGISRRIRPRRRK